MSAVDLPDAESIVGERWPRYGPYDHDHTTAAGNVLSELVRYLAYATGRGPADALPYAASIGALISGVNAGVGGLDQVVRQLIDRCQGLAADPTLYDSTNRDDPAAGAARVQSVIQALTDARPALDLLFAALNAAQNHLANLDHRESR